nr:retrovirus-related Pol polyprotein from transposon TNT 1-94 [Tanacetum cinerariifolium]
MKAIFNQMETKELLVYVSATCTSLKPVSKKLVVVTPINRDWKVSDYLNDVNARVKSKSVKSRAAKSKKKEMQKPTGKVYTKLAKQGLVRGLPKLKFEKDHLCLACSLGKINNSSHKPKDDDTNQEKLYFLYMDLCGPIRVESINGKKYILVIIDDYTRFTWVKFLRSRDEAHGVIIKCLKQIQVCLNATVCNVRTDNETEFVNQTLHEYYENVRISHQTSVARTPQQNGVVERWNCILVEVASTRLIFSEALLFLWAEAFNTACYTQNRSLIRLRYNKTPYELMHDKKLDLSYLHVFDSLCYPTNDRLGVAGFLLGRMMEGSGGSWVVVGRFADSAPGVAVWKN